MKLSFKKIVSMLLLVASSICVMNDRASAHIRVKHIARLKGQEEVTIQGLGLVTGLNGTGDGASFLPTLKGLASAMQRMNGPLADPQFKDIKDAKNVALVMVTATIPAAGARQGDQIEVMVTSLGAAKTLEHGVLSITPLLSPQAGNSRIYGLAQGLLQLDNAKAKTVARIRQGCRLEEDFKNEFVKDGKITIVLSRSQADFQVAQEVCNAINTINNSASRNNSSGSYTGVLAKALDQVNIEVTIPKHSAEDVVDFVAQVMNQPILLENGGRVIINERSGSIVISGDVEIGAVAVTHKNMVIDTGGAPVPTGRYAKLETAQKENPKLQNLITALNALKVSAEDQITIIKGIERDGKLYGMLIIE